MTTRASSTEADGKSCRSESLATAILAGGEGVRIGGDKPGRMLGGERLIDRAIANAQRWSEDVVIAARDPDQCGGANARFVADAPGAVGPIAGLAASLAYAWRAGHGFLLIIPCDTPFVPAELPLRLAQGLSETAGAAMAKSSGQLHPSCTLWRTRTFHLLGEYLASGRNSLLGFAEWVTYDAVEWDAERFDPFFNINSAPDMLEAERLARLAPDCP